jgi:hypothetical protein
MYFGKLGFLRINKDFLRKIFIYLDEKNIEQIAKELGSTIANEYVSSFFPEINSNTLIQFLDNWFGRFQSYQHRNDNDKRHSFSVNHEINTNFSGDSNGTNQ